MAGSLTQPVECRLVGAHLIGAARVEERDQDVGEHVAGEQDATVREEDRGVADGVRLTLDDLAWHGSPVRGQRGEQPDQLEASSNLRLGTAAADPRPCHGGQSLWVPRTVSHLLTSAFVVGQARRPPAIADQHDRSLWPYDSPTSRSDAC